MVNPIAKAAAAVVILPLLAACSETSVMDAFDAGKATPNEGLVTTNRPLSMPPDMALRQPGAANAPAPSNGLSVQQGQRGAPTYQAPPPPQQTYQQPPVQQQPAWQNAAPSPAPQQQQAYAQPAPAPQRQVSSADKVYYDNGINPYNADGTRKKQSVLNDELRKKSLDKKRAQNPNYGTIFNMGELWSGN